MSRKITGKKSPTARLEVDLADGQRFSVTELLDSMRIGLHNLVTSAGLFVVQEIMRLEAERVAGQPWQRHAGYNHWGTQGGYVCLGGQKIAVQRPRVRSKTEGREYPLESYQAFQNPAANSRQVLERIGGGLSTRRYARTVDEMIDGYGISRSTVSRQMVRATGERLREFVERDLSGFDVCVLVIDAIRFGGAVYTVALGIDRGGVKLVLGFREGATENATVVNDLLADLFARGLPNEPDRVVLAIIDGSKALAKAVRDTYGRRGIIQRCQIHKMRNVLDYLPQEYHPDYERKIRAAYAMKSVVEAERALRAIINELKKINISAANSLSEGLQETLTVNRLGVAEELRRTLRTTNMIESAFSHSRHLMKNVRRWRDSPHTRRWAATVWLEAESKFKRVRGYKHMPALITALKHQLPK